MKNYNGIRNGNKKKFSFFCFFGLHDWWWSKGKDDAGKIRCVVRCAKCHEMRALSGDNSDLHDMEEVRKTVNVPSWSPVYFGWNFIPFEITDDGLVKELENA